MTTTSLRQYLHESEQLQKTERVDEMIFTILAACAVAYTMTPILNSEFMKQIGGGFASLFGGLGKLFGGAGETAKNKAEKDKDNKDDKKSKSDKSSLNDHEMTLAERVGSAWQTLIHGTQKTVDEVQDEDEKERLNKQLNQARAISMNEDGTFVDPEEYAKRFEKVTGMTPDEYKKATGIDKLKQEDIDKAGEQVSKRVQDMSVEELEKALDDAKKKAKEAATQSANGDLKVGKDDQTEGSKDSATVGDAVEQAQKAHDEAEKTHKELESALKNDPDNEELKKKVEDAKKKVEDAKSNLDKAKKAASEATATPTGDPKPTESTQKNDDEMLAELEKIETDAKKQAEESKKAAEDALNKYVNAEGASDDEKKELEKKAKEAEDKAKEDKKKADDASKKEVYQVTHDGKPDKVIKRRKLRGEGYVYCYASDKKTTIAKDQAEEMIKKGKKLNESFREYLRRVRGL